MWKLTVFIPETHLEPVKAALFAAGAGATHPGYDHCAWQTPGQGQFRPLPGSAPFIGTIGQLATVTEYRVEMLCPQSAKAPVTAALHATHPYQQPAYEWIEISQ